MSPSALLPQDVVVLAKLLSYPDRRPSLARMATDLLLSGSQVHAALNRLAAARLVFKDARSSRPNTSAAEEFLVHGAKYMFPAIRGGVTRGMLTSYAAPPLDCQISSDRQIRVRHLSPNGRRTACPPRARGRWPAVGGARCAPRPPCARHGSR